MTVRTVLLLPILLILIGICPFFSVVLGRACRAAPLGALSLCGTKKERITIITICLTVRTVLLLLILLILIRICPFYLLF